MKIIYRLLAWFVTVLLPLALTFLGLRLMLSHAFLELEYRTPGFPPDEYGFTFDQRMAYARLSVDYLLNDAGPEFLADLKFAGGASVFNSREVSHMTDVKNVVRPLLWIGYALWALTLGLAAWARLGGWWAEYRRGVRRGGWAAAGLVIVIGVFAAVSFWNFFTFFHSLFFSGDSWLFLYTDTLIRLFPMRFWQDAFLFAGLLDLLAGLALAFGLRRKSE
jgi:integral membrane protein (TIGR01906 family)